MGEREAGNTYDSIFPTGWRDLNLHPIRVNSC